MNKLLSILFFVFSYSLFVIWGPVFYEPQSSVFEYGLNPANDSFSLEPIEIRKDIQLERPEGLSQAQKMMPLLIHYKKWSWLGLTEKRLLIFFDKLGFINFYDLDQKQIHGRTRINNGVMTSAPIFSPEFDKLYIKVVRDEDSKQVLISLNLEGKILEEKTLDLEKIYESSQAGTGQWVKDKVWCKTALSLNRETNKIYFGCSIKSQVYDLKKKIKLYGTHQGTTGSILQIDLDDRGSFENESIILTSMKTDNEGSGLDTGIYLSGGSLPIFKHNLFAATGNGPIEELSNNGCSILKLNLKNKEKLQIDEKLIADIYDDNECHSLNLDMASSSPNFISLGTNDYGLIVNKAGELITFDVLEMGRRYREILPISELPHYAQGAVYKNRFYTHYRESERGEVPFFSTALKSHSELLASKGFKAVQCIGALPDGDYKLLYSGRLRENFVLVPDREEVSGLVSRKIPNYIPREAPYLYPTKDLWAFYSVTDKKTIKGSAIKSSGLKADLYFMNRGEESFLMFGNLKSFLPISDIGWEKIISLDVELSANKCESEDSLWIYKKERIFRGIHGVKGFNFEDGKLSEILNVEFKENIAPNKHPLVLFELQGRASALYISSTEEDLSKLRIIDLETEAVIKELEFKGRLHFSTPLVTKREIIVPTLKNGILLFKFNE